MNSRTSYRQENIPFSKDMLFNLIVLLKSLISMYYKRAEIEGNWAMVERSVQCIRIFKYPLLFVWVEYGFGKDEDVWDEGEDMMAYMLFMSKLEYNLPELIKILLNDSPFAQMEFKKDNRITNSLLLVFTDLQTRLENGLIVIR